MIFLQQQREKLAAMAEMAQVAQAQAAVAHNVQKRMARIDALLAGDSSASTNSSSSSSSTYHSSGTPSYSSQSHSSSSSTPTANMSADEEVAYWKQKIAILSQPVTANGLAPPGTVPYPSTTSTSTTLLPSSLPSSTSTYQARQPLSSTRSTNYGHKVSEMSSPNSAAVRRQQVSRSPAQRSPAPSSRGRSQFGQTPSPVTKQSHHGEPVSLVPEGFPPVPPGWRRARDRKSGRYYLYRGSETTWETDRSGRRYKK